MVAINRFDVAVFIIKTFFFLNELFMTTVTPLGGFSLGKSGRSWESESEGAL